MGRHEYEKRSAARARKRGTKMIRSIHTDRLEPSNPGHVSLVSALETRFIDLCGSYLRIRGVELVPPAELDSAMLRWRTLVARYRQTDYRHKPSEMHSVRILCEWTVQVNCALRNQEPKHIEWIDS